MVFSMCLFSALCLDTDTAIPRSHTLKGTCDALANVQFLANHKVEQPSQPGIEPMMLMTHRYKQLFCILNQDSISADPHR